MHWKNCSRSCLTAMHHPFFALAPPTWVKVLIFVIPNAFCNLASRTVPPMLKPASWKLYVLAVHICIAVFYYTTPPDPPNPFPLIGDPWKCRQGVAVCRLSELMWVRQLERKYFTPSTVEKRGWKTPQVMARTGAWWQAILICTICEPLRTVPTAVTSKLSESLVGKKADENVLQIWLVNVNFSMTPFSLALWTFSCCVK